MLTVQTGKYLMKRMVEMDFLHDIAEAHKSHYYGNAHFKNIHLSSNKLHYKISILGAAQQYARFDV